MKLIVFGATGGTGQELVRQALEAGHTVTAFVRQLDVLAPHPRLRQVMGDVRKPNAVAGAIEGQDAVFSALGARSLGESDLLECASAHILAGMHIHHVRRLVVLGAAGALHPADKHQTPLRKAFFWTLRHTLLAHPLADSAAQERLIEASDIDYTIVHPPRLTDGPRTGQYRIELDGLPPHGQHISRADVAEFMLGQVQDTRFVRQGPYVAT